LPFSKEEQAVMAHKILLQLIDTVQAPVSLPHNLVGNVNLRIRRDTAVCVSLAESGYHADTGARSLEAAITRQVRNPLVQRYLNSHQVVDENQPIEDFIVEADRNGNIVIVKSTEQ
jgi:ATP-dependent Clp protease ATP-binding subunit ClpA